MSSPVRAAPRRMNWAAMPRTSAAVVFRSSGRGVQSPSATSTGAKPWEKTRITPSWLGVTAARISRSTAAASTQPCWWSVWLPPSSTRPGAEKYCSISVPPVSFSLHHSPPFRRCQPLLHFLPYRYIIGVSYDKGAFP